MITTLYFLNKFIFQWFFIRLAKVKGHGNYGFKYAFLYWIIPTTGWKNNYRYPGNIKKFKVKYIN